MSSDTVEISRREYEGMRETIEVLQDSEAVKSIEKGLKQLEEGKVKNWDEVKKERNLVLTSSLFFA